MTELAQTTSEMTFEQSVQEVLSALPKPLQDFLTGPERDATTIRISNRYNLHADQAGHFQKAFLLMLMGIYAPEQFASDLSGAGIPEDVVRSLARDVNEEVFKPIRAKEQEVQKPTVPTPTPTIAPKVVPTVPPASAPAPKVVPQRPIQPPQPLSVKLPEELAGATLRTMATDMMAVNEHKVPEPIPYKQSTPITRPAPQPIQNTYSEVMPPPAKNPPPVNLPGQTPPPLIKEYSVDPYKEPF
jgi:hypothetical protein